MDECLQAAQRCAELARHWRLGSMLPIAQVVAASAHGVAGRRAEMERLIAQALAGEVDNEVRLLVRGRCRAIVALLDEDHEAALEEFDAAMSLVQATPAPTLRPWFARWALLRTVHDRDASAGQGASTGACAGRVAHHRGADGLRGGRGQGKGRRSGHGVRAGHRRLPHPRTSGRLLRGADYQLALRVTAEAALDDAWGEPVRWLSEAAVFFHEHGHHVVVRACRRLLRKAGAPVPRINATTAVPAVLRRYGITEREHAVLLLVAAGRTSAQIADQLVISRRTVDKHVERLLAKTDTRRRGDLRGLLERSRT